MYIYTYNRCPRGKERSDPRNTSLENAVNEIYRHILNTVESKRVLLGMSKAELARRMEVDPVTLGTMLRGQRSMYADEAMKLCTYLDINPSELVSPELRKVHSELWGSCRKDARRGSRA